MIRVVFVTFQQFRKTHSTQQLTVMTRHFVGNPGAIKHSHLFFRLFVLTDLTKVFSSMLYFTPVTSFSHSVHFHFG